MEFAEAGLCPVSYFLSERRSLMEQENKEIRSFEKLWEAVQVLQKEIEYSYVEALGETLQNIASGNQSQQVEGQPDAATIVRLNEAYTDLALESFTKEQIRRMIQYTFLKAAKEDGLQTNHQMTPDSIGLLVAFMVERLTENKETLAVADFACGSGNLLSTVQLFLQESGKTIQTTAIDNDEVLVHLALQSFALESLEVRVMLQDGLSDLLVDPIDIALSDLPVGYYPVDERAKEFKTHAKEGHSYAHHLFIEQHLNYLKPGGFGFMIVPTNLFETEESVSLLEHLQKESFVQAMLAFPKTLFKNQQYSKSLLIFQKKGKGAKQARQVLLGDIPDMKNIDKFRQFTQTFEKWAKELS